MVRRPLLWYRDRQFPGIIGNLVCRTRFIDDVLESALADDVEQVVILGAGFDTRAYRITGMDSIDVFEVDHPEVQVTKRERLESVFGKIPFHVTLVPIDFDTQSLAAALNRADFDFGKKTLFIWEGVTQYITEPAVDSTLQTVAETAEGGSIVFTYIEEGIINGRSRTELDEAIFFKERIPVSTVNGEEDVTLEMTEAQGNPWKTGFDPDKIGSYLAERGLSLQEDIGARGYRKRYLKPIDREMRLYNGEHSVVATIDQEPSVDVLN